MDQRPESLQKKRSSWLWKERPSPRVLSSCSDTGSLKLRSPLSHTRPTFLRSSGRVSDPVLGGNINFRQKAVKVYISLSGKIIKLRLVRRKEAQTGNVWARRKNFPQPDMHQVVSKAVLRGCDLVEQPIYLKHWLHPSIHIITTDIYTK